MADDENQIRELLADMAAGYRAKDAERIVASYAPDLMDETRRAALDLTP
jgi:ketosteroid isomerase-like protein